MPFDRARVRDFARATRKRGAATIPRPSPPIPVLVSKNRAAREPTPIFSRLFCSGKWAFHDRFGTDRADQLPVRNGIRGRAPIPLGSPRNKHPLAAPDGSCERCRPGAAGPQRRMVTALTPRSVGGSRGVKRGFESRRSRFYSAIARHLDLGLSSGGPSPSMGACSRASPSLSPQFSSWHRRMPPVA
jgi:hypothetical protein